MVVLLLSGQCMGFGRGRHAVCCGGTGDRALGAVADRLCGQLCEQAV